MFIAVYFNKSISDDMDRADMEDRILDCFERGECTGGGGIGGCNIDFEVEEKVSDEEAVRRIRVALQSARVGRDTLIQIEGQFFPLFTE